MQSEFLCDKEQQGQPITFLTDWESVVGTLLLIFLCERDQFGGLLMTFVHS